MWLVGTSMILIVITIIYSLKYISSFNYMNTQALRQKPHHVVSGYVHASHCHYYNLFSLIHIIIHLYEHTSTLTEAPPCG